MIENPEKEQKTEGEKITVKKTLEVIHKVEVKIPIAKEESKKIHQIAGERYYEYDRLGNALEGAYKNLNLLSETTSVDYSQKVQDILETCSSLAKVLDTDISEMKTVRKSMEGMTDSSSLACSGTSILYDSTGLYEVNAAALNLSNTPPSVKDGINPYVGDQPQVEKELQNLLRDIDPIFEEHYLGIKEIFKTPQRNRLSAASADMRKLIWEIYRKLAPNDKVNSAPGFKQLHKDTGVPTYRQRIAYILTANADINGPEVELINKIYDSLDNALEVFSGKSKALDAMSDAQVINTMAQCERSIWSLLRNRKI